MKKLITMLSLCAVLTAEGEYRNRHVAEEWNTKAINFTQDLAVVESWYYLDWFGAYYQTYDWWIYHCDKGWLYPESDNNCGVWLWYPIINSWVWTHCDVYPYAWNNNTQQWFNFCKEPLTVAIVK